MSALVPSLNTTVDIYKRATSTAGTYGQPSAAGLLESANVPCQVFGEAGTEGRLYESENVRASGSLRFAAGTTISEDHYIVWGTRTLDVQRVRSVYEPGCADMVAYLVVAWEEIAGTTH